MDNSKKNVHNSGPLGMLVRSGQVKKIDNEDNVVQAKYKTESSKVMGSYFKTQSGLEFNEQEMVYVDPQFCEPWKYANRLNEDIGDIDGLTKSIKENKQLQPALIRPHPAPHGLIKYEVIFGRRRHQACLQLGIPLLAIKKDIPNVQDAIIFQEVENRARKDVSNYSNAILYKRLIEDKVFKNEKELSIRLGIPLSTLYDIMAYSRIPIEVVNLLPDVHSLSNSLALKIVSLLKESPYKIAKLMSLAPEIGKTITSPVKLEKALKITEGVKTDSFDYETKTYQSLEGKKLFVFRLNHRGAPSIEINKALSRMINWDSLCQTLKVYIEKETITISSKSPGKLSKQEAREI